MKKTIIYSCVLLSSAFLIGCTHQPAAQPSAVATGVEEKTIPVEQSNDTLFKLIRPSLVQIGTSKQQYFVGYISMLKNESINWLGRGIAIESGEVLSAGHLFEDPKSYYVLRTYDGTVLPIRNVWKDSGDIALLGVEHELVPYENISFNNGFSNGDRILTIIAGSVLSGLVIEQTKNELVSSLALEQGMSGSPLFTNEGILVGINSAISVEENQTRTFSQLFTIPFSTAFLTGDTGTQDGVVQ